MNVSAVIVTRGDVPVPSLDGDCPFDDVVVWDNSVREDRKVYGRYLAIAEAKYDVIYTQDDDCIVHEAGVIEQYESGLVACNMPEHRRAEYRDGIALVGWGAVFDRNLAGSLQRYLDKFPCDDLFLREADRVFTALNRVKMIDVPFEHLPQAYSGRMGNESRHLRDLAAIRKRLGTLR